MGVAHFVFFQSHALTPRSVHGFDIGFRFTRGVPSTPTSMEVLPYPGLSESLAVGEVEKLACDGHVFAEGDVVLASSFAKVIGT